MRAEVHRYRLERALRVRHLVVGKEARNGLIELGGNRPSRRATRYRRRIDLRRFTRRLFAIALAGAPLDTLALVAETYGECFVTGSQPQSYVFENIESANGGT